MSTGTGLATASASRPGPGGGPIPAGGGAPGPAGATAGAKRGGKADLFAAVRALPRQTRLALAVLAVALVAGAAIIPAQMDSLEANERTLNQMRGELSQIQGRVRQVKEEYTFVTDNISRYEEIQKTGLFDTQDRLKAKEDLVNLAVEVYLSSMNLTFEPERLDATKASPTMAVRATPLTMRLQAMLDQDVMIYLSLVTRALPGQVTLRSLRMERVPTVQASHLESITKGRAIGIINTDATLDWLSAGQAAGGKGSDGKGSDGKGGQKPDGKKQQGRPAR